MNKVMIIIFKAAFFQGASNPLQVQTPNSRASNTRMNYYNSRLHIAYETKFPKQDAKATDAIRRWQYGPYGKNAHDNYEFVRHKAARQAVQPAPLHKQAAHLHGHIRIQPAEEQGHRQNIPLRRAQQLEHLRSEDLAQDIPRDHNTIKGNESGVKICYINASFKNIQILWGGSSAWESTRLK
jgi:hypothetical protein